MALIAPHPRSAMKLPALLSRRLQLSRLGLLLLSALVYLVMRSGPLAPVRVTVVKVAEGSIAAALFGQCSV